MEVGGATQLVMEEVGRVLGLRGSKDSLDLSAPLAAPDLQALMNSMFIRSEEVKGSVRRCITSQHHDFGHAINRAGSAVSEFQSILSGFDSLLSHFNAEKQDSTGAFSLCVELCDLVEQLRRAYLDAQERKKALAAVERINILHQKVTSAADQIPQGDLLKAIQDLLEVKDELGLSPHVEDEDEEVDHLDEAKPYALLGQLWRNIFSQIAQSSAEMFTKTVVLDRDSSSLQLNVYVNRKESLVSSRIFIDTLLTAMDKVGVLETTVAKFADRLFKNVVSFILNDPLRADIFEAANGAGPSLHWVSNSSLEDCVVLASLYEKLLKVVNFLHQHLFCSNDAWMKELGRFMWPQMADAIISGYLSKAVPNEVSGLAQFQNLVTLTNEFELALRKKNFISRLSAGDDRLGKFASDVELHFAFKKKTQVISRARRLLVRSDFSLLTRKSAQEAIGDNRKVTEDGFELLFQPESCAISQAGQMLMELVHAILEDACVATSKVSVELYHAARDTFLLYAAIIPVKLAKELNSISQEAIIYHNDCLYLAHESLGLVYQYREVLPMKLEGNCIFVDLFPLFTGMADSILQQQLQLIGSNLEQALDQGNGFRNTSNSQSYEMANLAIDQVVFLLEKVRMIWQSIMIRTIYVKMMGILMTSVFARLSSEILSLDDMDVRETEQLRKLIFSLEDRVFPMLQSLVSDNVENQGRPEGSPLHKIGHLVPTWCKLLRLAELLDMPLKSITHAWESGNLVSCGFSSSEVQKLIKAIFSNTNLRKECLQRVAAKSFPNDELRQA